MNAKYADVVSIEKTLAYLDTLPDNAFADELPKGRKA